MYNTYDQRQYIHCQMSGCYSPSTNEVSWPSVSSWPVLLFFYVLLYCVMYHFHIELSAFYFFNENFTRSLNYKYCEYILK